MDHLGETYPPCPACEFPNSLFEPCHCFRAETPLRWLVIREAEPQEFPFPWSGHRTLLAVHSQLELRREESRHAAHHSFTGSATADVNCGVIPISGEPMSAPLQLLIQFVEYDVRQHGRERSTLRRPFFGRTHQPVLHYSGSQEGPDQFQQTLIADSFGNLREQSVVVDPVEEFFEIQIHHPAVAFGLILLRLFYRLMCRSLGP